MTYAERAIQIVNERDAKKMFRFLDRLEAKGMNLDSLPLVCDINACGHEGHRWAWDILEEWQNSESGDDKNNT